MKTMNKINHLAGIASAILAIASSGLAATADITGLNLWGQYGNPPPLPITVTTDQSASGNASLVFDVADSAGGVLSIPQVVFTSPIVGGIVTVSMKAYFPTGNKFAFLYGVDDNPISTTNYVQISSYANDTTGGFGQIEGGSGGYSFVRDEWKTLKFVIDLDNPGVADNGTFYYDDMITPAGTFTYNSDTLTEFWLIPSQYYTGTEVTGPFYFDDMEVSQGSTVVWSDNFDSYIPNGDPNLISIDVIASGGEPPVSSVAVSGDVTGSPYTGQNGLWNELPLDGGTVTLSTLKDGTGATASGVGLVYDSTSVGYHMQPGNAPYNPGVVLSADNPERSWVTGGESPVTFKFTGLTASAPYSLTIYTTGDPQMTLTVNGTPTLNPGEIFTTSTTANSNGEIVCLVSCGGETYMNYAEIAGLQLLKLTAPPAVSAHAGADQALSPGTPTAVLGATPPATGGNPPYTYSWSPITGLDDATLANPTVTTTAATTTYTLTVTDSLLATASDEVIVTYTVPPLVANAGADKNVSSGSPSVVIGGSPSASGGSGTYFYSWSPSDDGSLSSSTVANPTAAPTATTTYTLTVTDDLGTTPASDSVTVTYVTPPAPNPNLISVDYMQGSGTTCVGDTSLTGTTMKNAVGNVFTGQAGNWNAMNIGTYSNNSAISGFLKDGGGATTTVKLALGLATGLDAAAAGGWRCSPNEGALGGADQLRSESAYLYNGVITGDHYAWALTGLPPNSTYKLVFFGDLGNASGASNIANGVSGTRDTEGDWNWESITTDASGKILGTFTAPVPTLGLYGLQIEALGTVPSDYSNWATTYAGGQTAGEDYNNDGVQNGIAYFMGMNGLATNPGVVNGKVTWDHVGVVTSFEVQVSVNLIDWEPAATGDVEISSTQVIYTMPPGPPVKFCRLVVTP